jgi:hypothetical protein
MEQEGHRGESKYGMFSPWPPAKTVRKKNRRNDICGTKLVKDLGVYAIRTIHYTVQLSKDGSALFSRFLYPADEKDRISLWINLMILLFSP